MPASPTGEPLAIRTLSPHPLGHKVQTEALTSTGPRAGCGIHGQFCDHIETSPSSFHGTGVNTRPAVAPAPHTSRSRRVTFMLVPSLMAPEAAGFDMALAMAVFGAAHLHAVVPLRFEPNARDRMTPDIAAVARDAVLLIDPHFVGLAVRSVTFLARQAGAPRMNRVRKPDVGRLSRINQPGNAFPGLDEVAHQDRFVLAGSHRLGMTRSTSFRCRNAGECAVGAQRVAIVAVRAA